MSAFDPFPDMSSGLLKCVLESFVIFDSTLWRHAAGACASEGSVVP
jgi:hypothetical protein